MTTRRANELPRLSRRAVLRGAGAVLGLPFLEAMRPRFAFGLPIPGLSVPTPLSPLRLAFIYVPNGIHMADWTPKKTGTDFELPPILEKIGSYRQDFNILSGLTLNGARALGDGGGDHARAVASYLTGSHPKKTDGADIMNGISVDQLIAQRVGHTTRLPSLELGTESSSPTGNCDSGYSCAYASNMSWRTPTSPVAKEVDPGMAFDRLFRGTDISLTPKEREIKKRRQTSILDYVRDDADSLHKALGANDQRKLDEYLHAIREMEVRINRVDKNDHRESQDFERPNGVPRDYREHIHLLLDMMVLAFQTDSTRVATFMFANAGSNRSYRELEISDGHHELSHHGNSPTKQEKISSINRFHAELFAHFLMRMSETKEGDSNLLNNSLIMYGSGISDGNAHNHDDLPIILAGKGGGKVSTGRHIRFKDETPLTNLYVTLLNHMGIPEKSFSDSTGPLDLG